MKKINWFLVLTLVILFSCGNRDTQLLEVKPGFEKYVMSYTSGEYLSIGSHFIIQLQQSYSDSITPGTPVGKNLFNFSPTVKGKALWIDSRTIEFIPEKPLEYNSIYTVEFELAKIAEVPKEFATMKYQIKTIAQAYRFAEGQLSTYPEEMAYYKYESAVITADIVDNKLIENALEITHLDKNQKPKWIHDANGLIHKFTIDSISRQEKSTELKINFAGQKIYADKVSNLQQKIPGIREYVVLSAKPTNGDNQLITITFSDPLLPDQNLNGLVYLDNIPDPNLSIDGNKIIVTFNSLLKGKQTLHLNKGIRNLLSHKLKSSLKYELTFESIKPAVKLLGKGVIMPSSEGLIFPFEAVNLDAIDLRIIQIYEDNVLFFLQENSMDDAENISRVGRLIFQKKVSLRNQTMADLDKWNTFKVDLSKYINIQSGAIYRVEIQFRQSYSTYKCAVSNLKEASLSDQEYSEEVKKEMKSYDEEKYYWYWDYPDGYDWREQENPCNISYFNPERWVSKNLLVSDLGITAKGSPTNKYYVAVADLKTTDAVPDATVKFYNFQRQLIAEGKTDENGILFKDVKNKPYFAVVSKGDQKGYLKLDNGRALSLSNFNVGGMKMQEGMKGYIYGERSVWRPGDNFYLTFILEDKENQLSNNYPIIFSLYNPLNQLIESRVVKNGENGFYPFYSKTDDKAPTGNWTLKVKAGGAVFSKNIKIETIKPNRIKGNIDFGGDQISKNDLSKTFRLEAKWLHGAPASNLRYDVKLKLNKNNSIFNKFKQYNFDNQFADFQSEEMDAASGELNADGIKDLSLNINSTDAPGQLAAVFTTRIFEKGGDFSIMTQNITYSPYDCYIGTKMLSEGQQGWYSIDKFQKLGIVSVNDKGNILPNRRVHITIYKVQWRWWWDSYNDNLANYINSSSSSRVLSEYLSTNSKGKAELKFKLPYKNWQDNGRYLVMVSDENGGHISAFTAYSSEWYGSVGGQGEGATMLAFTSDKEKYNVGQEAEIVIPSSKNGRALVSLEKGSEILKVFWVKTSQNETRFKIPITKDMAPNIFIHISLIQPHNQTINDNPIRMYGVIPIDVEDPNTRLEPNIKIANKLEPEKAFAVNVSEKKGRSMTYTLAIVDEGLLDITGFRTPDPWKRFYSREAISIRTWDMYDFVIGAYGARLENAFSVGGGDEIKDPSKNKTNRFKPVVFFVGPFTLKAGEKKVHKFIMPNYIGSVRVMVVAGQKGAYGNAEKTVPVKKDLMILSTLPRVLGPNEEVKLPVTIFAMNKNVKDVMLSVSTNKLLKIIGNNSQKIHFSKEGEKMATFALKVNSGTGKATAHILAISGNLKATYDIELDVRNPNQPYSIVKDTILSGGARWVANLRPFGIAGSNSATIEISSIPSFNLEKRLDYLISYPYGCIEQTVSSAFPQLYLQELLELTQGQKAEIQKNIEATLNNLRQFQLSNGSFSYWPGQDFVNQWGTNYAGHFLLKAKEKGYNLPNGMLEKWVKFQKSAANSWVRYDVNGGDMNQAYRLYLLAMAGNSELGAMNRMRENNNIEERARIMLAGAYMLVNQKTAALKIFQMPFISTSFPADYYDYSYGSSTRDDALKALVLKNIGKKAEAFALIKKVAKDLASDNWMSTQTTAMSLMAVSEFFGKMNASKGLDISLLMDSKINLYKSNRNIISKKIALTTGAKKSIVLVNNSKNINYVSITIKGRPAEGKEVAKSDNLKLITAYYDMSGNKINPYKIKQGTDFKAVVTIVNPAFLGDYQDLALSQIFPSGWEIINSRLFDIGGKSAQSLSNYQDIRDDRVLTFFELKKHETATFTVMLNAAYEGKYYLPATICGSMYNNRIEAVIPGGWVEVIKN